MKWWEYVYWWCIKKWWPIRYGRKFNRFLDDHPEHPEWDCVERFIDFCLLEKMGADEVRRRLWLANFGK